MKIAGILLGFTMVTLCVARPAFAVPVTFTFDENGNAPPGSLPGSLQPDTSPGGLSSALTYELSFGIVAGDVLITEPGSTGVVADIVRFIHVGDDKLVFYSDNVSTADSLADTGLPTQLNANTWTIAELGPEGNNGALYTPTSSQPGFDVNRPGLTYYFVSDAPAPVPEPSTLFLLGLGLAGLTRRRVAPPSAVSTSAEEGRKRCGVLLIALRGGVPAVNPGKVPSEGLGGG